MAKSKVFKPNSKHQVRFIEEVMDVRRSIVALISGRQGGKSWAGAAAVGSLVYLQPERTKLGLGWCVCPTYLQSKAAQDAFRSVLGWAQEGGMIIDHKSHENTYLLARPGRSPFRLEFKTAENPDSLRGRTLDFVWFDEAAYIEEYCWDTVLPCVLATGGPLILTTTPRGRNWVYNKVYAASLEGGGTDETIKVIRAVTDDNPALSESGKKLIKTQHSGVFYKQEILGEFTVMEGLVYHLDEEKGTFGGDPTLPPGELVGGIDFGFKDPFVYLWVWKGRDGSFWVLDEYYKPGVTMDLHASTIRSHPMEKRVTRRHADPSNAQGRADLERLRVGTFQACNDLKLGINLVSRYLDSGKLHISKKCKNLIREMQGYQWKKEKDLPVDKDNHALDALRYVIASEELLNPGGANPCTYTNPDGSVTVEEGDGGGLAHLPTQEEPDAEGSYGWSIEGDTFGGRT